MAAAGDINGVWTQRILNFVEPVIFGKRHITHIILLLITALLTWQASKILPDAGFEKSIPLEHPYMKTLKKWESDFGGGNTILVAAIQKDGEIYNEQFLDTFKRLTDEVFFVPGVDRVRVRSIFTPNTTYVEVVEGGLSGENVIPGDYAPSDAMFKRIKENVGKAQILGRLVTEDHRGALVYAELLEEKIKSGEFEDEVCKSKRLAGYACVAYKLEQIRVKLQSENIDIHIVGFAKVVGDVTEHTVEVIGFFGLALIMTTLLLWLYCGSLKLAMLPLGCSVIAVLWEFGLLRLFGFGLDPFAILVPFLVLSVSVSHGVQYVNAWVDDVAHGKTNFDASLNTFRRLAIPGTTALITDVAGFITILLIPIAIIQEMALNAAFGVAAIIITNKMLMPIWLTHVTIKDIDGFTAKQQKRDAALDKLWTWMAKIVRPVPATITLIVCAISLVWAAWMYPQLQVGDAQKGVPELRPDSRYNNDNAAIVNNFSVGTDIITVIVETHDDACIDYNVMEAMDRFSWHMQNTPGVQSTMTLNTFSKLVYSGFNEGRLNAEVLPRNRGGLSQASSMVPASGGMLNSPCSALAVNIFTEDHKAETIARIVQAVKDFNAKNKVVDPTAETIFSIRAATRQYNRAQTTLDEIALRPDPINEELEDAREAEIEGELNKQRSAIQNIFNAANTYQAPAPDTVIYKNDEAANAKVLATLQDTINNFNRDAAQEPENRAFIAEIRQEIKAFNPLQAHNVNFALATGNVGVMAATNEEVEKREIMVVAYVYVIILIFMWLSFRSIGAVLCVVLPLSLVSVMAYGVMAELQIGLKVATLPVVALAVGIGVDYGIYIYSTLLEGFKQGLNLEQSLRMTLSKTGKAVVFTGIALGGSVSTWLMSGLQFQIDMGLLLVFMFTANMFGAILVLPVLARFFSKDAKANG